LRRRLTSVVVAILMNVLLLIMLLEISPSMPGTRNGQGRTLTFNVSENQQKQGASKPKAQAAKATRAHATAKPVELKPTVEPPTLPPRTHTTFIELSHDEFASTDVSQLPSQAAASGAGKGEGAGEGDTDLAGGSGPHGEPLYSAAWYREPTDAELGPYLAKTRAQEGNYGEIACKTVARYHVEDCVALNDSPPGTHISRELQDAAFQFLVRPPRVGGKSLVGAWVRIRITISNVVRERR